MKSSEREQILNKIKTVTPRWLTEKNAQEGLKLCKEVEDSDIELMIREAKAFKLMRKPKRYVILVIFFRYRIPILYHKIVNFITGY